MKISEMRVSNFVPPVVNPSGIYPTEYKVLIRPDDKGNVHKFKGSGGKDFELFKPDETADREKFAQVEGTLIATSALAFSYANATEWGDAPRPKPGDRVLYAKYAGTTVKGKDGVDYRLVNDKDLSAVLA